MQPEFIESLFICGIITVIFLVGYGVICLLGLMIIKVWDRTRRKSKWQIVRRCL